jgi:hypothetical protein
MLARSSLSPETLRLHNVFEVKFSMRQRRRLIRSDRIARNLLWLMVLVVAMIIILALRTCHG